MRKKKERKMSRVNKTTPLKTESAGHEKAQQERVHALLATDLPTFPTCLRERQTERARARERDRQRERETSGGVVRGVSAQASEWARAIE